MLHHLESRYPSVQQDKHEGRICFWLLEFPCSYLPISGKFVTGHHKECLVFLNTILELLISRLLYFAVKALSGKTLIPQPSIPGVTPNLKDKHKAYIKCYLVHIIFVDQELCKHRALQLKFLYGIGYCPVGALSLVINNFSKMCPITHFKTSQNLFGNRTTQPYLIQTIVYNNGSDEYFL
ncbi:uncharacterized protein [Nicotiana sylvestris]|uniref:uncharacterized protein isoform X2 n=1 Tax=Nicotiana sylvestris TaxID=4096 RepID=UPI00388CEBA9